MRVIIVIVLATTMMFFSGCETEILNDDYTENSISDPIYSVTLEGGGS